MTANFDAAKSAALAITLLDWRDHGAAYAAEMAAVSMALAQALDAEGIPLFAKDQGFTSSHQFAVLAESYGGGQAAAKKLRRAGFLACGIGLPAAPVAGDANGLRIGTPELVRRGMMVSDMPKLAGLIARGLSSNDPESLAGEVRAWRETFDGLRFVRP